MATANTTSPRNDETARNPPASVRKAVDRYAHDAAPQHAHESRAQALRARAHAYRSPEPPRVRPERHARDRGSVVGDYAERAVLIPVGAALIARDRVVASVNDTISTYSSTHQGPGPAAPLRAPRRHRPQPPRARGSQGARARRARTAPAPSRVEREVRQRRRAIEKTSARSRTGARRRQERHRARQPRPGAHPEPRLRHQLPPPGPERPASGKVCRPHIPPAVVAPSPPSTRGAVPIAPRVIFCGPCLPGRACPAAASRRAGGDARACLPQWAP